VPDIAVSTATTTNMQVGVTFNGALENSGDRDWIRVSLTAGQAVQIDLGGRGGNAVYDTFLRLYNAKGAWINEDDDSDYSEFTADLHSGHQRHLLHSCWQLCGRLRRVRTAVRKSATVAAG
jgi:hypothetical protein